jgi:cobalamin biosynthesis protein CobD/CbiB
MAAMAGALGIRLEKPQTTADASQRAWSISQRAFLPYFHPAEIVRACQSVQVPVALCFCKGRPMSTTEPRPAQRLPVDGGPAIG